LLVAWSGKNLPDTLDIRHQSHYYCVKYVELGYGLYTVPENMST